MTATHALGFEDVTVERELEDLPVKGALPGWLRGSLLRNGPAKFRVGERAYRHWFDGLAMLHRFAIADGAVSYSNRYLESPAYQAASEGRLAYGEFASDPCRSIFKRVTTAFTPPSFGHNANVNISVIAEQLVAMTETPMAVAFDPDTLATAGIAGYDDDIAGFVTTAHPLYDFDRRENFNYLLDFGPRSTYQVYGLPDGSNARRKVASINVKEPAYIHSFGMTEHYVVLVEFPLVVNPLKLLVSGKPFIENYEWKPERGATFHVIDKSSGEIVATATSEPFFAFHHVNAWEEDGAVLVDICAYDDPTIVDALYLDRVVDGIRPDASVTAKLRRYRVPLAGGAVTSEQISDVPLELPRINFKPHNGKPYRYAYGTSHSPQGRFIDQLAKIDVHSGESVVWHEPDTYPGEPVFIARPDGSGEDDGVVLSVVLDAQRETSFLLCLDAATFAEVARAEVPQPVPFGFHGQFLTEGARARLA
jgi:beta,beta-carotene 9',10'-dioxygenase